MYSNNGTLYPMLGVGAFMSMFWAGVVAGYELGLGCTPLLILGLLSGCIATVGVCELQRRDAHGLSAGTRERTAPRTPGVPRPTDASRPTAVPAAVMSPRPSLRTTSGS